MTVEDLIESLRGMPQSATVVLWTRDEEYAAVTDVRYHHGEVIIELEEDDDEED